MISEKVKKFGVHRYIPQSTADDDTRGGGGPGRVKLCLKKPY